MAEIDYEKILKDALNNKSLPFEVTSWIEEQFPQLAESEDERIRKEILDYIIKGSESLYDVQQYGREKFEKWIAWLEKRGDKVSAIEGFETEFERQVSHLIASAINREHEYNEGYVKWTANALLNFAKHELEKQGEQKPVEMKSAEESLGISSDEYNKIVDECIFGEQKSVVIPKFRVGDWVLHKDLVGVTCCITQIHAPHYYLTNDNSFIKFGEEDNYRLWTIKDAKAGDVLADNGAKIIFIFKNIEYDSHIESNVIKYFIRYSFDGINLPLENGGHLGVVGEYSNFVPATKEQRDLLLQKMHEAGYEWDTEKKELKKIEQKPAWSEEDEQYLEDTLNLLEGHRSKNTYGDVVEWLKELKDRVGCEANCTTTWKPSEEQIKVCKEVYADLLSAKGFDLGTVNGELNRLEEELKKLKG